MSKVIKLIVVVDETTADLIGREDIKSVKEREAGTEAFMFVDAHGLAHDLHFVAGEVV